MFQLSEQPVVIPFYDMSMYNKWLALILMTVCVASCSSFGGQGELTGTRKQRRWSEPHPYGMVMIPAGSLNIGNNDEDVTWGMSASSRSVSVQSFWMDETEITNDEYRQFVKWVIDSVQRQHLADAGLEEFLMRDRAGEVSDPPRLNYRTRIDTRKEEYTEALSAMMFQGDNRIAGNELDVRKLEYAYSWYDFEQAARNDRFYDPETGTYKGGFVVNSEGEKVPVTGRASFVMKKRVRIYPDTLCWLKDLTYAYNEPYVLEYFSNPGYDDYPVAGVNWHQAGAFCNWRTHLFNDRSVKRVHEWRLPNEAEWEYAARGGLQGSKYPWGGPYTRNSRGSFLANFKPLRGDYVSDGGFTTVPVGTYAPNPFGLYDMAGNMSEWTADSYDESAYEVMSDMGPHYAKISAKTDNKIAKRMVVRGGSWRDIAYYIQCGTRSYEYQDSARCYVGFRTVRTRLEF